MTGALTGQQRMPLREEQHPSPSAQFCFSTNPALSSRPAALSLASALAGRSSEHTAFARDPFRRGSIAIVDEAARYRFESQK